MIYLLLAFLAGTVLPVQAGVNGALRDQLGHPIWATLVSFFVGTCTLAIYAAAARLPLPGSWAGIEVWKWTGGALGTIYLTLAVILNPKLGAATTFGLVIAGQLAASLVLDHFGWLGVPQHSLNLPRVAGVVLMLAGVFLVRKF
ncbi:MAG TPA: DMT family transporter [Abditibacterium sp.]|jgi:transporter family-2 protein